MRMLDWETVVIPVRHDRIHAGRVLSYDEHGVVEWETEKRRTAKGSHDCTITLRSGGARDASGKMTELTLSGNITKWIQGHNLFGTSDLTKLLKMAGPRLQEIEWLGLDYVGYKRAVKTGNIKINRIDVTEMVQAPCQSDAEQWIRIAGQRARTRFHRSSTDSGTFYIGKTSTSKTFKAYSKFKEIQAHKFPKTFSKPEKKYLEEWAEGTVRMEWTFRGKWLRSFGIGKLKELREYGIDRLFREQFETITIGEVSAVESAQVIEIDKPLRATIALWETGIDCREHMSRATYYRHKRALLDMLGVDISQPPNKSNGVVRLSKTINLEPMDVIFDERYSRLFAAI